MQMLLKSTVTKFMQLQAALLPDEQADAMQIFQSYGADGLEELLRVFDAASLKQSTDFLRRLIADWERRGLRSGPRRWSHRRTTGVGGHRSVVRDLDDDGRRLWVDFGKTKRSRRPLEVPAILRPYLLALAKGRAPDAQLISRTISRRSGKKRDRFWLLYHVERLCAEAEVPVVCTQSLWGFHASVATDAGATSHVVGNEPSTAATAGTKAPHMPTRRAMRKVAADLALRVVSNDSARAGVTAITPL